MDHSRFMRVAIELAKRNLGRTWPNPCVGAVIVKDGQIIGQGVTAQGGRPHAEPQALLQAGSNAQGATLYVTLEPCAHHGQTPPCTEAVMAAGLSHVVIACADPNPLVAGKGIVALRNAGIKVTEHIETQSAAETHRGFFSVMHKKRPYIALKLATSLDGKMATRSGESKWITGERARGYAHLLRSRYDAIATGIGTVLADDPLLTCRLPGLENRSPVRVVFNRQNRLPATSQLAQTSQQIPLWHEDAADIPSAIQRLVDKGITRLLVEAGPTLSTAFLKSGLVDRIYWFRAPLVIGDDGRGGIGGGFTALLAELPRFKPTAHMVLQPDTLEIMECSPAL